MRVIGKIENKCKLNLIEGENRAIMVITSRYDLHVIGDCYEKIKDLKSGDIVEVEIERYRKGGEDFNYGFVTKKEGIKVIRKK